MAPAILSTDHVALPRPKLAVFEGFVPDEEELAVAYERLSRLLVDGQTTDMFISLDDLGSRLDECARDLDGIFPDTGRFLADHLRRLVPICRGVDGVDPFCVSIWFVTLRQPLSGVYCHFDNNFYLRDVELTTRHPIWATILHLTPPEVEGGATTFCLEYPIPAPLLDSMFELVKEDNEAFRSRAREWISILPRRNRLVVFHGGLAHLIERFTPVEDRPRMTLLVNFWDHLPLDPDDVTPGIVRRSMRAELRVLRQASE